MSIGSAVGVGVTVGKGVSVGCGVFVAVEVRVAVGGFVFVGEGARLTAVGEGGAGLVSATHPAKPTAPSSSIISKCRGFIIYFCS